MTARQASGRSVDDFRTRCLVDVLVALNECDNKISVDEHQQNLSQQPNVLTSAIFLARSASRLSIAGSGDLMVIRSHRLPDAQSSLRRFDPRGKCNSGRILGYPGWLILQVLELSGDSETQEREPVPWFGLATIR